MVKNKSKELERSELNRAIDAFINNGGTIKKMEIRANQNTEDSGISTDRFDPYMEAEDPDRDSFVRVIGRNNIDCNCSA